MSLPSAPETRPLRIRVAVAAGLVAAFSCAFIIVAVVVGVDAATNHGTVGTAARDFKGGRSSPAAGVWFLVVALTVGAIWLARSAIRAIRQEGYGGIVVPLGFLLLFGSVGEIIDMFGRASGMSDLLGGGILFLAAIPVVLLWRPMFDQLNSARGRLEDQAAGTGRVGSS